MTDLNTYFQKHGLCAENILYIYRKDRKTVIQRTDGEEFALFIPVHSPALPVHFLDVIGRNCLFVTSYFEIKRNKE